MKVDAPAHDVDLCCVEHVSVTIPDIGRGLDLPALHILKERLVFKVAVQATHVCDDSDCDQIVANQPVLQDVVVGEDKVALVADIAMLVFIAEGEV